VTLADVQEACRALNRQLLDTLATHLEGDGLSWQMLVVSDGVAERLGELERRCRHRERLPERLGPAFGVGGNRGVRALLTGPSGAGKTLAARILAAELGMDLYRVDLAAVVNKYIGETEKNLHRVLSTAEDLDVVLLLDEGDALLGSRTEVRTANDRYANLETNYLLQRLESYQGIVLITTNAAENIDSAFQRRMDVVLNFTAPQAEERWHIWRLHLPPGHAVEAAGAGAHRRALRDDRRPDPQRCATGDAAGAGQPAGDRHRRASGAGGTQRISQGRRDLAAGAADQRCAQRPAQRRRRAGGCAELT
jgi:SpoVK/Ycf46/Vps4 family AAA+-type ATPase